MKNDGNWIKGPDLPRGAGVMGHCLCPRTIGDSEQFIIAGGARGGNLTSLVKNVFMYDFNFDQWSVLPDLPEEKAFGTCSPYTMDNGHQIVLYAGWSFLCCNL